MARDTGDSEDSVLNPLATQPVVKLSEREEAIAKRAAKMAVQEMTNDFYRAVGKTVISRLLIVIGLLVVGFATAKGWLKFGA